MKEFIYSGETLNNYPHGQGMILYNDNETFTGTWDKGLRVNTGVYNINQSTYEVEFKEGKICRLLNLDHRGSSEEIILTFKQPNYIKKGDYYEEIEEIQECTFKVINNKILNNGMPIKLIDIYDLVGEIVKIQSQKGKNILAFNHFTYEGRCLQNIPLGPGKLLLKDSFYIIGYFRGYSFSDTVKIVNNETELSFTENSGKLPTEVRLYYKDCDLNVLIYTENRSKVQFSIQNVRSMNNIKNILTKVRYV